MNDDDIGPILQVKEQDAQSGWADISDWTKYKVIRAGILNNAI